MFGNSSLKINNNLNINMPSKGKKNSYTLNSELPCFFIKNHYLSPLEKSYSIKLTNPVYIEENNMISFNLKLPKQIFSQNFIYEINNFPLNVSNFYASLQFKSSNSNTNKILIYNKNSSDIEINDFCGWIIIKLNYTTVELSNLYEINYSIGFDNFKLKKIKENYKSRTIEIIKLDGLSISFDLINVPKVSTLDNDTNETKDTDGDGIGDNADTFDNNIYCNDTNVQINQIGADIDGEAVEDYSGWSVSLSGDGTIVAIGSYNNDGNGAYSGHVRVYQLNDTNWIQRGTDIDGEAVNDFSGRAISLNSDGSIIAIGAYNNNGVNGPNSGHVRVYEWNNTAWIQRGNDIDGEAAGDAFGFSVSLNSDGSIVAIGAIFNDSYGTDNGHVRVYEFNENVWVQRGTDIDGEFTSDYSGWSVSLSDNGSIIAIGANLNDGVNGLDSGHVRVYEWIGTAWVQRGLDIDGEASGNNFGYSVSLSSDGSIVAIGGNINHENGNASGHVRVYEWNNTAWVQRGNDIDGESAFDFFGTSVSLSSDGSIIAIGANGNDGNGIDSGHVKIYKWNETTWIQQGSNINGEAEADNSGYSVSLSSDGSVVAIGAVYNDGINGLNSGHVRVYNIQYC